MTTWTKASPDLLAMAGRLIETNHHKLLDAKIGFLFRDTAGSSQGKETLGKAQKVPDRLKPYLNLDFMIWISEEDWNSLPATSREALLDHELSHCTFDENDNPKIVGHDIEEFVDVIKRHGAWNLDLARTKDAIQDPLPGMEREGAVVAIDPKKIPIEAG